MSSDGVKELHDTGNSAGIAGNQQSQSMIQADPGLAHLVLSLQPQVIAQRESLISFWVQHGPDRQYGGFHNTLDRQGKPVTSPPSTTRKGIVTQARYLWTLATYYQMFYQELTPSNRTQMKTLADKQFDFIMDHLLDKRTNLFWWQVDRTGKIPDKSINLYGNFFAILGLASYAKVFHSKAALDQALATFRAVNANFYDPVYGGYDQSQDQPVLDRDKDGRPVFKGFNANLHGMEALAELYDASGDEAVRDSLVELIKLLVDKAIIPCKPTLIAHAACPGGAYGVMFFDKAWNPILGFNQTAFQVSHGHFLEFFWLLIESLGTLADEFPIAEAESVLKKAAEAAEYSATMGTTGTGGYCDQSAVGEKCQEPARWWWVQDEALLGLWRLYEYAGKPRYLANFRQTFDWVMTNQTDPEYGEQYAIVNVPKAGAVVPVLDRLVSWEGLTSAKANFWKASYHSTRTFMNLEVWMQHVH